MEDGEGGGVCTFSSSKERREQQQQMFTTRSIAPDFEKIPISNDAQTEDEEDGKKTRLKTPSSVLILHYHYYYTPSAPLAIT